MRRIRYTTRFERDVRLAERRGKDLRKLKRLLALLTEAVSLPASYADHPLKGRWAGHRDVHLEPDWIVIYRLLGEDEVVFERTWSHSDLFKE
jgi:mRNA interferase YafQ